MMMAELNLKGTMTPTPAENGENPELSESSTYSYPNPFDSAATIRFVLEDPKDVRLRIYDINGTLVWHEDLAGTRINAGLNTVTWRGANDSGENVANGVYVLEVSAGKKAVKKLMALVRSAE
jgi:hypothetical protein